MFSKGNRAQYAAKAIAQHTMCVYMYNMIYTYKQT